MSKNSCICYDSPVKIRVGQLLMTTYYREIFNCICILFWFDLEWNLNCLPKKTERISIIVYSVVLCLCAYNGFTVVHVNYKGGYIALQFTMHQGIYIEDPSPMKAINGKILFWSVLINNCAQSKGVFVQREYCLCTQFAMHWVCGWFLVAENYPHLI